jgi:hypothetical protein
MSQKKTHFLTYILDVLSPGVKFERPENREALEQDILAWHRAALERYGEQVRKRVTAKACPHCRAEGLGAVALPPIEEGEVRASIKDVGRTKPIPFEDPWAKEGEAT